MNKENTAEKLIASRSLNVTIDPQNGWYLKRFAALQFEGSVDNFSTNMPIHVLEQQLPKDDAFSLCIARNELFHRILLCGLLLFFIKGAKYHHEEN